MKYGLEMYSVRDYTGKDMDYALREVAAMGYDFVEFAGFSDYSAETIKSLLQKYNLTVSSTHTGINDLVNNFDATVAFHKTIGNKNIIIPGADLGTKAKLDKFIDAVNAVQPKLAAEGMLLHYHNHSHEFLPNADGLIIHTELENRTKILFQIDTYWAFAAKVDPVEIITRLKDRIKVIHLKDGDGGHAGKSLGAGVAPVKAVRNKAIELGFDMVVESETLTPDGIGEAKRCIDYLRYLDSVDGK
jgi:sugar phosphate isomerase/epimerase